MTTLTFSDEDVDIIANLVEAEAGSLVAAGVPPDVAYRLVGETITNRMASPAYGGSLRDVVSAKHQFEPVSKYGGIDKLPKAKSETRDWASSFLRSLADGERKYEGVTAFANPYLAGEKARKGWLRPYPQWMKAGNVMGSGRNVHVWPTEPMVEVPDYEVALEGELANPMASLFNAPGGMASSLADAGDLAPLAEGGASMMADLGAIPTQGMASGVGAMGGTGIPWADIALIAANAFSNMGQPDPQAQAMAERNSQQAADEATQRRMAWAMQNGFGRGLG